MGTAGVGDAPLIPPLKALKSRGVLATPGGVDFLQEKRNGKGRA